MEEQIKRLISVNSWFISLEIVTLLAFLVGAALLYADFQQLKQSVATASSRSAAPPPDVTNWADYIRSHSPTKGDAGAPIVIEEFTDFQCPFCKSFNENIRDQLLAKYGDKIQLVFKHYPLEAIHPDAKFAAVAAQCALREGKFWEIKDFFFANPDNLSLQFVIETGASLGLSEQFLSCVANEETLTEVEQDIADGEAAGIQGTPTFLINGKVVLGASSLAQFESVIEELD